MLIAQLNVSGGATFPQKDWLDYVVVVCAIWGAALATFLAVREINKTKHRK